MVIFWGLSRLYIMKAHAHMEHVLLSAYEEYADAIFRHCFFRVNDRERAKELSQEVFVRVWEYLQKHTDDDVENMQALLYRIARNLIIDEYRGRKKQGLSLDLLQEESGFDAEDAEAHRGIIRAVEMAEIQKAMKALSDHVREALILRYIDDMSVKDIAALTQETENAVSVRLHRGIAELRKILKTNE